MARVLVSESDPSVRSLLETVIARSGHDAVTVSGLREGELPEADLLVAEPAYGNGLRHARALRERHESLPIVLVSILPPMRLFLSVAPAAYLMKPFSIAALEQAVADALPG